MGPILRVLLTVGKCADRTNGRFRRFSHQNEHDGKQSSWPNQRPGRAQGTLGNGARRLLLVSRRLSGVHRAVPSQTRSLLRKPLQALPLWARGGDGGAALSATSDHPWEVFFPPITVLSTSAVILSTSASAQIRALLNTAYKDNNSDYSSAQLPEPGERSDLDEL